jgi:hypothetical protein
MRPDNANANTHAKLAWVTYAYCYTHGDSYSDSSSESNTYAKLAWVAYAYTHGDCHSYCSAQGNTKASSDSASSAVSA